MAPVLPDVSRITGLHNYNPYGQAKFTIDTRLFLYQRLQQAPVRYNEHQLVRKPCCPSHLQPRHCQRGHQETAPRHGLVSNKHAANHVRGDGGGLTPEGAEGKGQPWRALQAEQSTHRRRPGRQIWISEVTITTHRINQFIWGEAAGEGATLISRKNLSSPASFVPFNAGKLAGTHTVAATARIGANGSSYAYFPKLKPWTNTAFLQRYIFKFSMSLIN